MTGRDVKGGSKHPTVENGELLFVPRRGLRKMPWYCSTREARRLDLDVVLESFREALLPEKGQVEDQRVPYHPGDAEIPEEHALYLTLEETIVYPIANLFIAQNCRRS
ncbi:hypothetical protein WG66_001923 [Moniliophthora roreri]|nr:hypothetical protein WG66_001923 [Moniliophthora roreri]